MPSNLSFVGVSKIVLQFHLAATASSKIRSLRLDDAQGTSWHFLVTGPLNHLLKRNGICLLIS